jgi:hypothetical protein
MFYPHPEGPTEANLPDDELFYRTGNRSFSYLDPEDDFEEERTRDVVRLGREGYCHYAALLIWRKIGGVPCGLRRRDRNSIAHYYIHQDGYFWDMGGGFKKSEVIDLEFDLVEVDWSEVISDIRAENPEEGAFFIVKERFLNHLSESKNSNHRA